MTQKGELLLASTRGLLPRGDVPRELCVRRDADSAPVPHSRARRGAPGELPWGSSQTLLSTSPRRPLPASWADLGPCSDSGKMGSSAWYAPGLPDVLHLPAFSQVWVSKMSSSLLRFIFAVLSLSSAQISFLFLFLEFSFSWWDPEKLSIPQRDEMGKAPGPCSELSGQARGALPTWFPGAGWSVFAGMPGTLPCPRGWLEANLEVPKPEIWEVTGGK